MIFATDFGQGGYMYFEIRKNRAGKFWWRAVGGNHEIMAASELMNNKADCTSAINTVKTTAASAAVADKTDVTTER
jgi:uncharacterized protein YegP (UPF0339 family)